MPYRPPCPGDLLAVRVSNADERQVLLTQVSDTGTVLTLSGALGDQVLDVVVRRIGPIHRPVPVLERAMSALHDLIEHAKSFAERMLHHEDPAVRAEAQQLKAKAEHAEHETATLAAGLVHDTAQAATEVAHDAAAAEEPVAREAEKKAAVIAAETATDVAKDL